MTERSRSRKTNRRRAEADVSETQRGVAEPCLANWVTVERRYTRSINLERDLAVSGSIDGYVMTPRAFDALGRLIDALGPRASNRAFTITGVYGTGKSAFVHFLAGLLAPAKDPLRSEATRVLTRQTDDRALISAVRLAVPSQGFVRAVVTARRESAASAVARALYRGAREFFGEKAKSAVLRDLARLASRAEDAQAVEPTKVFAALGMLADESGTGVALIVDELGKVLEHAAASPTIEDVFLFQQLAEMPTSGSGRPIVTVGILHRTFAEYGYELALTQRTEWQKVQGRFEDVAYSDAPEHMLSLVGSAIAHKSMPVAVRGIVATIAQQWHNRLEEEVADAFVAKTLSATTIAKVAPLHPVAALVLPLLCARYAQYDRSLFAFLNSREPHSFGRFLEESTSREGSIPLYRASGLYDYFIDVAGHTLASSPHFQRWAEVHGTVSDARTLAPDLREALKTIAVLNLIATSGPYRASRSLVLAALCGSANDRRERERWLDVLDSLQAKGLITYRNSLDEYRVWEGSEFDVDVAVRDQLRLASHRLAPTLADLVPPRAIVAQRHSFESGTLRFFERNYVDDPADLTKLECASSNSDGLVCYWLGSGKPMEVANRTSDGRPIVTFIPDSIEALKTRADELAALKAVLRLPQLQADGVARREVMMRIALAQASLEKATRDTFEPRQAIVMIEGNRERVSHAALNGRLSDLCDDVYSDGIQLLNELVNRRELTSAGARARREVIEAMIRHGQIERLGIQGNGPDASLYESVLNRTGIHRKTDGRWTFGPPVDDGIRPLWTAIERFCLESRTEARSITSLFVQLERPPYGVKQGVVPIVLAAVWLFHVDDVSVYLDGRFLPSFGPETFEILVKQPERFSVKYFELSGLRWQLLRDIEDAVRNAGGTARVVGEIRNASLLGVIRPLVAFIQRLPQYSLRTEKLSAAARAVRDALLQAREPDELLFSALPTACGILPFDLNREATADEASLFRRKLGDVLKELGTAYDQLLDRTLVVIHSAFGTASDSPANLRADLRVRAQYLVGRVIDRTVQAVVNAAVSPDVTDREWLEALITVIAERPADVWTDDDEFAFELRVTDVARRLANLWALVHEAAASGRDGFEARRLTITHADGHEAHKLVWVDHSARDLIEQVTREVLGKVQHFPKEQQFAVAASIAEAVFGGAGIPEIETSLEKPAGVAQQDVRSQGKKSKTSKKSTVALV